MVKFLKNNEIALFNGIEENEIARLLKCINATEAVFSQGDVLPLFSSSSNERKLALVISGKVSVERTDESGALSILEVVVPGEIFGEGFTFTNPFGDSLRAVCSEKSKIMFLKYDQISKRCCKACPCHSQLVENLLFMITDKMQLMSQRLEILSCRGTRSKLLSFFTLCSAQEQSNCFTLPFSVSALADYLCVDRSAMVREMKKMRMQGIIENSGREITLLKNINSL